MSITMRRPLGAQKKTKEKKIKSGEIPREKVQKASKQMEPSRILKVPRSQIFIKAKTERSSPKAI